MPRQSNLLLLTLLLVCSACALPSPQSLWVGTNDGVLRGYRLSDQGQLQEIHEFQGPRPLQFVAFHPYLPRIYAAVAKGVQAYALDGQELRALDFVAAGVRGTHLDLDPSGRHLLVASYGGNALLGFAVDSQGRIGERTLDLQSPKFHCEKAHQVRFAPGRQLAYAPCLGSDRVQIIRAKPDAVTRIGSVRLAQGVGPRHLAFTPDGTQVFVLNERASSIYNYRVHPQTGALNRIQVCDALPENSPNGSRSSDIQVSADGRFVYAVHREPLNQIVTLRRQGDGQLTVLDRVATGGRHSRSFALSADGRFVVLAHSRSKDVIVRRRDPDTGRIGEICQRLEVGAAAVFAGFAPASLQGH